MPRSEAQKRADAKYKAETMAYQTFTVRKDLLTEFKEIATVRGEKVNTLLREFLERYVRDFGVAEQPPLPAPPPLPDGVEEIPPAPVRTFRRGAYLVEVIDRADAYECWLSLDRYDYKMLMFAMLKPQHTIDDAIGLAMLNLDKQIELYKQACDE